MRADKLVQRAVRTRFLVTMDTEESFDGVLTQVDPTFFVFEDTFVVAANGDRQRLDTAFWVPRPRVKYMQAVTV